MFVLGDEGHYHGRFPWVTGLIVLANVVIYTAQMFLGPAFTIGNCMTPVEITTLQDIEGTRFHNVKTEIPGYTDAQGRYHPKYVDRLVNIEHYPGPKPIWLTLLTSLFLHADVWHLIGNMWFLLVFGRNVECALGHLRFLIFYLACGVCAGLAHVASAPESVVPCLGASGAISGVMGAYVAIHPLNTVKLWFALIILDVPALIVIGLWFVLQYLSAFIELDTGFSDGVAYWCHLGGFCSGFLFIRVLVLFLHLLPARRQATTEIAANDLGVDVRPGESDPYGSFLTVQILRKMQEEPKSGARQK